MTMKTYFLEIFMLDGSFLDLEDNATCFCLFSPAVLLLTA